jgi:hypothetical protein
VVRTGEDAASTKAGLYLWAKVLFPIAIHACAVTSLNGLHLASMSGSAPLWVQSLTAFKKHSFGIEDKLSFERAFHVQEWEGQMIRLQHCYPPNSH